MDEMLALLDATSLRPTSTLTFVLECLSMGYERDYFRFFDRHSNFDPGSFPSHGYQHRHGGTGDRHPKKFRRKERNRPGASR